ncbi:MAG TPA: hypothetical protein VFL03_09615 [Candidatus Limnocylindrales bacterium]|jgi:hypothetical protein|nr:hypothetical protein [Candidatus Limnocylindrales bacterium]
MSFLKRLFGGSSDDRRTIPDEPPLAIDLLEEEQARDRELLRADAERLDDELIQRQMRYAQHAWTPPAQGTDRRADDEGAGND